MIKIHLIVISLSVIISFPLCRKKSNDLNAEKESLIAVTQRDANGKLQVFTIRLDGSDRKQLTFEGENGRPRWSPDGKRIAYCSTIIGQCVMVMDTDGSNKRFLAQGVFPDWSRDGNLIAFTRPDINQVPQIWVINTDGNNLRQITTSSTTKIAPSWSHDGAQLSFTMPKNLSPTDPQPEIAIVNADGTNERILTTTDRINIHVETNGDTTICETANDANASSWSPVENKIAFWSGIENQYGQIWVINVDGTGSKQLTEDCGHKNSDDPSWSPDGKKILFSTGRSSTMTSAKTELWVMDADGSNERRVTHIDGAPFPGTGASWQPKQ